MTSLATLPNQTFTTIGLQTPFSLTGIPQMSIQVSPSEMSPAEVNFGPSKKLKTERNSSGFSQILEGSELRSVRTDQISISNEPKSFINLPTPSMNTHTMFQTLNNQPLSFPMQFVPVQIPNGNNLSMAISEPSMLLMNNLPMDNSIFNCNNSSQTINSELSNRLNLLNQRTPQFAFPQNSATLAAMEANFNPYLQLQGDKQLWKYLQEQQEDFDKFLKKIKNLVNSCASNPEDRIPEDFLSRGNAPTALMFRNRDQMSGSNRRSNEGERRVRERGANQRRKRASDRTSNNKRNGSDRTLENI